MWVKRLATILVATTVLIACAPIAHADRYRRGWHRDSNGSFWTGVLADEAARFLYREATRSRNHDRDFDNRYRRYDDRRYRDDDRHYRGNSGYSSSYYSRTVTRVYECGECVREFCSLRECESHMRRAHRCRDFDD